MKITYVPIQELEGHVGAYVLTEGKIEVVYPIKEDFLYNYIFVDSLSPVQRGIYMSMDTQVRKYRITDGKKSVLLLNAPLYLYEGERVRIIAKVVRYRKNVALKFKKLV